VQNETFDRAFNFDGTPIDNQNPKIVKILVPHDGVDLEQCAAGNYTSHLQNGNGNQEEIIRFRCGGGDTTYVNFIGSAISIDGKQVQPTPTVTAIPTPDPTYGIEPWPPIIPPTLPPTPTVTPTITIRPTLTIVPTPTVTHKPTCKPHHRKHWWHFWEFEAECA
jgi:hypothetical protein